MNARAEEWRAGRATRFLVKHAVAAAVTVGGVSGLLAAIYFILLALAILTNGDIGSPVTLPFVLVAAVAFMTAVALAVFLPVTVVAGWICTRNGLTYLYEIPIAGFLLVAYIFLVGIGVIVTKSGSLNPWYPLTISLVLLPALGLYWLGLQSTGWLLIGAEHVVTFVRRARSDGGDDDDRVRPD